MDYKEAQDMISDHLQGTGGDKQKKLMEAFSIITGRDQFLTNIYNKKKLLKELNIKLSEAHRTKNPLSFGMLDIDHFKRINDDQKIGGHQLGDQILIVLSYILPDALKRKTDIFGRYGGEEFGAVMSATKVYGARNAIDHARKAVENNSHQLNGITISGGVADSDQAAVPLLYDKDGRDLLKSYVDNSGDFGKENVKSRILKQADNMKISPESVKAMAGNLYKFFMSPNSAKYSLNSDFEEIALDCIVNFADKALYQAKNSGRNRVCGYQI